MRYANIIALPCLALPFGFLTVKPATGTTGPAGSGEIFSFLGHTIARHRDRQTDRTPVDREDDSCSVLRAPAEPGLRQSW